MWLANKAAIVTGGDSGIGHAISLGLAQAGAAVTINYHRDQVAAEATRRHIIQADGKARIVQADVANVANVANVADFQEQKARLDGAIPLGHVAQPAEIANLVVWLASDRASYGTATTYFMDGGLMQASVGL